MLTSKRKVGKLVVFMYLCIYSLMRKSTVDLGLQIEQINSRDTGKVSGLFNVITYWCVAIPASGKSKRSVKVTHNTI